MTGYALTYFLTVPKQQIGELSMEVELLKERVKKKGPLVLRRST